MQKKELVQNSLQVLQTTSYEELVGDCQSIITEGVFNSQWTLIETYHEVGKRIRTECPKPKESEPRKDGVVKLLQRLAVDLHKSTRTLFYAVQFFDNFPEINNLPIGKNASWNKVIALLPEPKEDIVPIIPTKNILLIKGDVLKVGLPEVDVVFTDPPYNVTGIDWDMIGTDKEYLDFTKKWISRLKWKKHCFICCSPKYMADYEMILRELNYPIKSRIVWVHKNMSMGKNAKDKFINCYDMIFHCGQTDLELPKEWKEERFDVKEFAVPQTNFEDVKLHQTQKPKALIEEILRLSTKQGDSVLDCFAGSGSTGVVCNELGLTCFLVEKEPKFIKLIEKHLCLKTT